jgi:hypothetical protein
LALAPTFAWADAATEIAGLFMQACLPYAGDPEGLRAWAGKIGLPHAVEQARSAFLHGAAGQVFDASDPDGKFVLVSSDDGLCSAVTDQVTEQAAINALESDLRTGGVRFRLVIERDDKNIQQIHDREYLATKDGHSWRILLATVKGDRGGQAMMTSAPE